MKKMITVLVVVFIGFCLNGCQPQKDFLSCIDMLCDVSQDENIIYDFLLQDESIDEEDFLIDSYIYHELYKNTEEFLQLKVFYTDESFIWLTTEMAKNTDIDVSSTFSDGLDLYDQLYNMFNSLVSKVEHMNIDKNIYITVGLLYSNGRKIQKIEFTSTKGQEELKMKFANSDYAFTKEEKAIIYDEVPYMLDYVDDGLELSIAIGDTFILSKPNLDVIGVRYIGGNGETDPVIIEMIEELTKRVDDNYEITWVAFGLTEVE